MNADFEHALERCLEGGHSPADESLLIRTIQNDVAAHDLVRRHLALDDLLRQHEQRDHEAFIDALRLRMECAGDELFVQRVQAAALQRSSRTIPRTRTWMRLALAAAAVLVICGAGWMRRHETTTPSMAKVSPAQPVVQISPMPEEEPMPINDEVVVDANPRLFTLPSKVRVLASAGASLTMVNDMELRLIEGRVSADAGDAGKGFTVHTPQASIVDLGTLFGVQSQASGYTDVFVFSGSVSVAPKGTRKAVKVVTGQSVRIDDEGRLLRLASVTTPEQWQLWQTEPPPSQCIASIEEPDSTTGVQAFHRIMPAGMKDGASVRFGHPACWSAAAGKSFPRGLIGAEFVQSPPSSHGPLKLRAQRAGTIYLLVSQAAPPPKWLTSSFTRTNEAIASVIITDGRPKARISVPFDVWKLTLEGPGVLTLGEPARMADGKPSPMYSIAAKAR